MNVLTIDRLFKNTDVAFPADTDFKKAVRISESGEEADAETVIFVTKRASGKSRELKPCGSPYAIVCEEDDARAFPHQRVIVTENVRKTLAIAYSNLYGIDYSKLKLIAVTGTNGKTTVAGMLHQILRYSGADVGYIGTGVIKINETVISEKYYSMTTPDPALLYRSIKDMELFGCTYIVMEASSHGISLEKLAPIKFDVGIFTNLSEEHRDFHPDMASYFATKLSLFERCEAGIFNLDCPYSARAYELAKCEKSSVGIISRGEVFATDIQGRGLRGTSFYYREEGLIFGVDLRLAGAFNVYNALMALKCAIMLGVKPCIAKQGINSMADIEGRMEMLSEDITVVIDYAHTPLAVENALKTLYSAKRPRQRLLLVIGCGGERDREKRQDIGRIAEKYCDRIYLTEDNSRSERTEDITADILRGIRDKESVLVIPSRASAIGSAVMSADRGDIVAILGKGREPYMITDGKYVDYSDIHEAQLALRLRKTKNENNA